MGKFKSHIARLAGSQVGRGTAEQVDLDLVTTPSFFAPVVQNLPLAKSR